MSSEPAASHKPSAPGPDKPPHYQPSVGRKLFMMGLCVLGLIFVWIYYYLTTHTH
jgi:hypothetical protein